MKFETLLLQYTEECLRVVMCVCDLHTHQGRDVVRVDDGVLSLGVEAGLERSESECVVKEGYLDDRELVDNHLEHALQVRFLILRQLIDVHQEVVLDAVEGATEGRREVGGLAVWEGEVNVLGG